MKIKNDLLKIHSTAMDEDGRKLEPEAQPAARVISTEVGAAMQSGQKVGGIRAEIVVDTNVADLSAGVRRMCFGCKHFDNAAWVRSYKKLDRSTDMTKRQAINQIRAALLTTSNAALSDIHADGEGDIDTESALAAMGKCQALSENFNDDYIVHPLACCPDDVITAAMPQGFFQPRDRKMAAERSKAYDLLLRKAQGKTP